MRKIIQNASHKRVEHLETEKKHYNGFHHKRSSNPFQTDKKQSIGRIAHIHTNTRTNTSFVTDNDFYCLLTDVQ